MSRDITHSRARCQRWWCWLFHPSRCPTSSHWGRNSGLCSLWSGLLPAESLRATHAHISSKRQNRVASPSTPVTHPAGLSRRLFATSRTNILQLVFHWQLSGYERGTFSGTSHHSCRRGQCREGVTPPCGCKSSDRVNSYLLSHLPLHTQ